MSESRASKMLERMQVYFKPIKSLGQNFLVNKEVARIEAEHARGKKVLELGSGYGVLTGELCKRARRVVAVELDKNLFASLKGELKVKNLKLVNKDFFDASDAELELSDTDIMIANVPYKLSSKVIDFLLEHSLQAVLCLQKEFVQHMLAKPGTNNYSRLSVMFQLCFSSTKILDVSRGNFRPVPKVDSVVVYVKPKSSEVSAEEKALINALMQHKKKTVRNALMGSCRFLHLQPEHMAGVLGSTEHRESRVFKLAPEEILKVAKQASTVMSNMVPVSAQV